LFYLSSILRVFSRLDFETANKSSERDDSSPETSMPRELEDSGQSTGVAIAPPKNPLHVFTEIMYFSCFCLNFLACIAYGVTLIVLEATDETDSLTWMTIFPVQV
jgi:hypothetical protein